MKNLPKRAISKLIREINFVSDAFRKSRKFRDEKNYDLRMVEKGFSDHKVENKNDSLILERICSAYTKAKDVQQKSSPIFKPSNEWLPIYEMYLKETIEALSTHNLDSLSQIYSNFWRHSCSTGLVGLSLEMNKDYFGPRISRWHKILWLNDAIHRYRLWKSLLGNTHSLLDIDGPCIGNPYGYYIDGHFIASGSDYQHYYATAIGRLLIDNNSKCVVELGAGYGGMAYYLLRDNSDVTYIDLDLPENSALTAYYLLKAFPERNIKLFGEIDFKNDSIQPGTILIMPSFEIDNISENSAGVVFNSYSLAEMSQQTILTYINEFTRIICKSGYFMHVNHNKNSVVVGDNFGVDQKKFDLIYKIPALWNMGRNSLMDEFEYLYKKTL